MPGGLRKVPERPHQAPRLDCNQRPDEKRSETKLQTTDQALAWYNHMHQEHEQIKDYKEPQFSDFYKPSPQQQTGELVFISGSLLAAWYAAYRFCEDIHIYTLVYTQECPSTPMEAKLSKIYYSPKGLLERPCRCQKASCRG